MEVVMLKPDSKDPNYKEQIKVYEDDPSSWGPEILHAEDLAIDEENKLEAAKKRIKGTLRI